MRAPVLALVLMSTAPVLAEDDAVGASQSQVAQIVVVARDAALLCPDVQVDPEGIHALMDHTQITDHDLMAPDRFGPEDEAAARSFKAGVGADPGFCDKILAEVADRLHFVRRRR